MSIDITFQKNLNLKEIQEKTNIQIVDHNGKKYLSHNGNVLPITDLDENGNFSSISQYGRNELSEIIDIIVPTFQTKFITDNEWEIIIYEQNRGNNIDVNNVFNETTKSYGYDIK